ncbi:hypothetical protein CHS0354_002796 [Potamilus streckersoni]|uniref:Methionine aminopeptidase n=1 Tax=Potamilus streckersoni TaxID=2493646 RepID=A0AAE0SNJ4_9BIVA|nr:hypothetical protein CHS0354_002796 [Potamilus streckersoni]
MIVFRKCSYSVCLHLKSLLRTSTHELQARYPYSIVKPWRVSSLRKVPDHIPRPQYAVTGIVSNIGDKIEIKNQTQIEGMRKAGRVARQVMNSIAANIKVGVTTDEIDQVAHEACLSLNAYPSPLHYRNFPKSICTSVNNVACHGIPDTRPLENGDIISMDVTVYYKGFHGDTAETFLVGEVDIQGKQLVEAARQCRDAGISVCRPGARFCDIGNSIWVTDHYRSVDQMLSGSQAHEDDAIMLEGMTFTIEPILSEGSYEITVLSDGWTAVSVDDSRSAQFEHTVLVTADGVEILTK